VRTDVVRATDTSDDDVRVCVYTLYTVHCVRARVCASAQTTSTQCAGMTRFVRVDVFASMNAWRFRDRADKVCDVGCDVCAGSCLVHACAAQWIVGVHALRFFHTVLTDVCAPPPLPTDTASKASVLRDNARVLCDALLHDVTLSGALVDIVRVGHRPIEVRVVALSHGWSQCAHVCVLMHSGC
jgi:hypothetical protein